VSELIQFREYSKVELIDWMPRTDAVPKDRVAQAARVSSGTEGHASERANTGLLKMLQRDRHGSPFEHVVFTWRVETPIFVAREFMRHRIASYNETSGRYRELEPLFYMPPRSRKLVQKGKPGAYEFEQGTDEQYEIVREHHEASAACAWHDYQAMLNAGIAREVARNVLPLSIFTSFYVTMNFRAFQNFASLRWAHPAAEVPTFPLYEIQQVCVGMESDVDELCSEMWDNFNNEGRRPV
jgi:thymidylate synthase (FAD)